MDPLDIPTKAAAPTPARACAIDFATRQPQRVSQAASFRAEIRKPESPSFA